jgi:hypothetical protein
VTPLVQEVLAEYDQRIPGARDARTVDEFTHVVRTLAAQHLAAADWAMELEGVGRDARRRVLLALALGTTTPLDARQRQAEHQAAAQALAQAPTPRLLTEAHQWFADDRPTTLASAAHRGDHAVHLTDPILTGTVRIGDEVVHVYRVTGPAPYRARLGTRHQPERLVHDHAAGEVVVVRDTAAHNGSTPA